MMMRLMSGWLAIGIWMVGLPGGAAARNLGAIVADMQRVESELKVCRGQIEEIKRQLGEAPGGAQGELESKLAKAEACSEKLRRKLQDLNNEFRGGDPKDVATPEGRHARGKLTGLEREVQAMLAEIRQMGAKIRPKRARGRGK